MIDNMINLAAQIERQYKRKVAFCSIIGSINYKLNTNSSDLDVVVWVYPNTLDLLKGKVVREHHKTLKSNKIEYDIQMIDIRDLTREFYSGNTMWWEQLYSDSLYTDGKIDSILELLRSEEQTNKYKLARGIKSLAYNHSLYLQSTETTHLDVNSSLRKSIEQYGYSAKSLSNILRSVYMLKYYALEDTTYENLLVLPSDDRNHILSVKYNNQNLSHEQALTYAKNMIELVDYYSEMIKINYKSQFIDENRKQEVQNLLLNTLKDFYNL